MPGDPVRQIHWKLSEKTDRTMVRDLGLPVVEQMLLLLDTAFPADAPVLPETTDLMLALLSSVSSALLEADIPHTVGWRDSETGAWRAVELSGPEDLEELTAAVLVCPMTSAGESAVTGYLEKHVRCPYAHVR
jgi:uncharacterized protein (DUF58 family)